MAPAGLRTIATAKANGSWTSLDAAEALEIHADLAKAFARNKRAKGHYDAFPPSARKCILMWVGSAKTQTTRTKRIRLTVELTAKKIRANRYSPQKETRA